MNIRHRTTVFLSLGLLLGLSSPVWSADSGKAIVNAKVVSIDPPGNSLLALLKPVPTGTATDARTPDNQCTPSHIYSQHDVVGDRETCEMSRHTFGTAP
jgi:hypothetical protein